jgi:hypothetical protein
MSFLIIISLLSVLLNKRTANIEVLSEKFYTNKKIMTDLLKSNTLLGVGSLQQQ